MSPYDGGEIIFRLLPLVPEVTFPPRVEVVVVEDTDEVVDGIDFWDFESNVGASGDLFMGLDANVSVLVNCEPEVPLPDCVSELIASLSFGGFDTISSNLLKTRCLNHIGSFPS